MTTKKKPTAPTPPPPTEAVECWHFLADDSRVSRGGQYEVTPGMTETFDQTPALCERGLHGSVRAIDALRYARGTLIRRVEVGGVIVRGDDKLAGQTRRELCRANAAALLHEFGCWCAERALLAEREAGREPDARCWAAIEAKRGWVAGRVTDAELAASEAASEAASWASRAASRAAAWAASRAASWAASEAASEAASWAASWASRAEIDTQNAELERRLRELMARSLKPADDPHESETVIAKKGEAAE